MSRLSRRLLLLLVVTLMGVTLSACVRRGPSPSPVPATGSAKEAAASRESGPCAGCATLAPAAVSEVMQAVAQRVADLKARGGACLVYGTVLESSLAEQRIFVRPFMWRVGPYLASAQAKSTGEIDVAREIDELNVGRRSLDEVVHSVEHEAAHIAFGIPSGAAWNEALVDERVNQCSAGSREQRAVQGTGSRGG